jgi:hypothetical protein
MDDVAKFYGRLVYFPATWYFYGNLVYLMVFWYIFPFSVYCTKKNMATVVGCKTFFLDLSTEMQKKTEKMFSRKKHLEWEKKCWLHW